VSVSDFCKQDYAVHIKENMSDHLKPATTMYHTTVPQLLQENKKKIQEADEALLPIFLPDLTESIGECRPTMTSQN